jgi:hypothetical protein
MARFGAPVQSVARPVLPQLPERSCRWSASPQLLPATPQCVPGHAPHHPDQVTDSRLWVRASYPTWSWLAGSRERDRRGLRLLLTSSASHVGDGTGNGRGRLSANHPKCQTHNTCSFFRRARYPVITSRALRSPCQARENSHGANWNAACSVGAVMDIVQLAIVLGPLLGTTVGYLIDGVTGATSGFVIPIGPLVVAWLVGGR